ncbi:MAG: DUF3341 domain-containing protein [Polyangiaceae bacterium]
MSTSEAPKASAKAKTTKKKVAMVLAEFDSSASIVHAAEKVRDQGFKNWDTYTPYPIHGMDGAMGLKDSKLGWIVLTMACTGISIAFAMMMFMNGIDYPIIIGGKPADAFPSMVPVMFELTILFSAFGSVFGMFHLNRLPRHHHPVFYSDRFRAASDDKYFLSIEAEDPKFDEGNVKKLLESLHATFVEVVEEEV